MGEAIEKLALSLESNLEFLGCLGVKEVVKTPGKNLILELKAAGITPTILSGDKLQSVLQISKELGYQAEDMNSGFWIRGRTIEEIEVEIERIMDTIYLEVNS